MRGYEKIDIMMKITHTSNSILGKYLTFDASYISRIRRGKRKFPEHESFAQPVSHFFTEHIVDEYQKKITANMICPGMEWPQDPKAAEQLLFKWITEPEKEDSAPIGNILSGIASIKSTELPNISLSSEADSDSRKEVQFFYGNEGKRKAVALFLSELGTMEQPPRLLLYSNEEFDWMYEDAEFAKKWAMLLFGYIRKGGKIRIAHTISRASGEMLEALRKWIPIYMTGAVEPYYYPKILDRVFRKTMFIAEGHSAIVADSVGEHTEYAPNLLIRDQQAVKAIEEEYRGFLSLCKPLMKIFNMAQREAFLQELKLFHGEYGNMISVRRTPSFYTMSEKTAKSMGKRRESSHFLKRWEEGKKNFEDSMEQGIRLTEILNLPSEEEISGGKAVFTVCDLSGKRELYYTPEEFAEHLESMIEKLTEYPSYQVILSSAIPENEIVYVKEDEEVILIKADFPEIAFVIKEQRMVSSFWDYLSEVCENGMKKKDVICRLQKLVNSIRRDLTEGEAPDHEEK